MDSLEAEGLSGIEVETTGSCSFIHGYMRPVQCGFSEVRGKVFSSVSVGCGELELTMSHVA